MTIDEGIKRIAEEHFPGFSYIFDDWYDIDQAVDRTPLPAIAHVLPIGGVMTIRQNGKLYDRESVTIAFLDKVTRDANGGDQRIVFERMKDVAIQFVRLMNESGYFASIGTWSYNVIYNQLSSIVTGVMLTLDVESNGIC